LLIALSGVCLAAAVAGAQGEIAAARAEQPPVLDGRLDDPCWRRTPAVTGFTRPLSKEASAKPVSVKVSFDDAALYLAVTCSEPNPGRLRANAKQDGPDVWKDDCVELFLRTTENSLEFDQFIVNTAGAKQSLRRRAATGEHAWTPGWQSAVRVGAAEWSVEVRIPFVDIELAQPEPGQLIELKLGREDYTTGQAALSTWPPGSTYGGASEYGALYLGDPNRLPNPDLSGEQGDRVLAWGFSEGDAGLYASVEENGQRAIRVATPGRYSTMSQSLRLKPNSTYRLSADVKGDAGIYLRARTVLKPGGPSVPHTADFSPSPEYRRLEAQFPTGPDGNALIILGSTETSGKGTVYVRNLQVTPVVGYESAGPAIPVRADAPTPTVVTKLLVVDSRVVRGFVGAPFDGTLETLGWNSQAWEYPQRGAGAGVGYDYRNNDGLHVRLADSKGFDAILVRGGIRAKLYAGEVSWQGPGDAKPVYEFPGKARTSRALFEERVVTERLSFFDVSDGTMSNVAFFRIGSDPPGASRVAKWQVGDGAAAGSAPDQLGRRFEDKQRRTGTLVGDGKGSPVTLAAEGTVHFVSAPLDRDLPLAALGLDFELRQAPAGSQVTVAVQDPIDPRLELMGVDLALSGPGRFRVVLDFPDQVVPKGQPLWLTWSSRQPAEFAGSGGAGPEVLLYETDRATAVKEALPYRKFLMKSFFCCASEARPWMGITKKTDLDQWYATNEWGAQVREVMETVEHCRWLDPTDDTVRQYHEWLWQRRLDFPPFVPKIDQVPGAPEWATVARQAWLSARGVAKWWLDNRLTPTGEFGGVVGDDSDMYQNYVDLCMFETDGVAAQAKAAAANLAELAEQTTLEAGLNKRTMDPLHAYEEGLNQEALMAVWNYGDPVYLERCMVAARSTEALITVTPKGHRHFKSQECGAQDLRMDRKTDVDGHAHPLMWHPAFEVLWYNRNPKAEKLLRQLADGWLEHMEPRKYATSVDVATEKVTETTTRPLYGGYGGEGSAFCFLSWITGDEKYLQPFYETFAAGNTDTSPGNLLPEFIHHYELAELKDKLPSLVQGRGIAETLVTGNKQPMIDALKRDLAELQRFPAMYTTAEPFTDRIFLNALTNAALAYTGGYATRNKYNRSHAVSWSGFGTDYAALVLRASPRSFKALLYNFRAEPVTGEARLWTLDHGAYQLRVGPDQNADDQLDRAAADRSLEIVRGAPVRLMLPGKTVVVLELTQTKPLDDPRGRPDLALSAPEVRVEGSRVVGVVHNLGGAPAPRCIVALVDGSGRAVARKDLGALDAPLDLSPKRVAFALEGVPANHAGWSVVLDPDDEVEEIYEGNNRVEISRRPRAPQPR
jgi:hypothetical protein